MILTRMEYTSTSRPLRPNQRKENQIIMNQSPWITRFNPAVSRKWLLLLAGLIWTGVGLLLCSFALRWLTASPSLTSLGLGLLGLAVALAAYRLQFGKLALKNIERIFGLAEKACVFAFQAWKGYLIIVVMMTGGMLLRHSALPKPYLAVVYAAIGVALVLASSHYYRRLFHQSERL